MSDEDCVTIDSLVDMLQTLDKSGQIDSFRKIQKYVLVTIFGLVLQLAHLFRPFAYTFFRLLSMASYILVPVLISYLLGLMGRPPTVFPDTIGVPVDGTTIYMFQYLSCVWLVFLLFAYAGFDNLNAFSLEERYGRSKLLISVGTQFVLLVLVMYKLPLNINVVALSFAFVVLTFKLVGRLVALAHSAGATPRIKNDVISIINFSNRGDDAMAADPVTMAGYNYLVGPKYTKIKDGRIIDGVTMEKVLRSPGRLLADDNMELKDTGLSFALFWLLLGKYWSYPLYDHDDNKSSSSRAKAWKFVRHGLIAEGGGHERVFRVIETELAFLREYFHARYIFFYLNGFYWKLVTIVALPAMFWWFLSKTVKVDELHQLTEKGFGNFGFTITANKIVISVIVVLEIIQLAVFLSSRWLKVNLLCYYVNKMTSKNVGCLSRFVAEVLGFVFLGSWCSSNCRN